MIESRAKPLLMSILNVTPDSFSDGGAFFNRQSAIEEGLRQIAEGADIVDVGGESTRPGATQVSAEEEIERVAPVITDLVSHGVRVSVDTSKSAVARAAMEAGASIVNDVTALRDSEMAAVCAEHRCTLCLMHMQGTPETMQIAPYYENVVQEVRDFLLRRAEEAMKKGIPGENLWIDPGIGFGKSDDHNLALLQNIDVFVESGFPVLLGVSRKGYVGRLLSQPTAPIPERLTGTLAIQSFAQLRGVSVMRCHDVREARRTIDVLHTLVN